MSIESIPLLKVNMPDEAYAKIKEVMLSGYITTGPKTCEFEEKFGAFIGNPNVVATNSCSSAISLALHMAGVHAGDDVICTPLTCIAVNEPVLHTGANIIWADIDVETGNISSMSIRERLTEKTKAIVYSHWCGYLSNINAINNIAKEYNLVTIEDAASALGGEFDGKPIGSHSDFVTFSFQAIKHITTGDGGMLAMKVEELRRAVLLRNHGNNMKAKRTPTSLGFDVYEAGWKYQMNDLSASIGLAQLPYLNEIIRKTKRNKKTYDMLLKNIPGLRVLKEYPKATSNLLAYTLLVEDRENFIRKLQEHGIGCGIIHMRNDKFQIFKKFECFLSDLEKFYTQMINIPVGFWVEEEDVHRICNVITSG